MEKVFFANLITHNIVSFLNENFPICCGNLEKFSTVFNRIGHLTDDIIMRPDKLFKNIILRKKFQQIFFIKIIKFLFSFLTGACVAKCEIIISSQIMGLILHNSHSFAPKLKIKSWPFAAPTATRARSNQFVTLLVYHTLHSYGIRKHFYDKQY